MVPTTIVRMDAQVDVPQTPIQDAAITILLLPEAPYTIVQVLPVAHHHHLQAAPHLTAIQAVHPAAVALARPVAAVATAADVQEDIVAAVVPVQVVAVAVDADKVTQLNNSQTQ